MSQHVVDPSFEQPASWVLGTDCAVNGAAIVALNPRTGLRALALSSRSVGPQCGFAEKVITDLVPGNSYRVGLWWDAQGVSALRNALVILDGILLGTISGVTPGPGQYQRFSCPLVFVATASTAILRIEQPPGSSTTQFTRYFDDIDVSDVIQGVSADPASLSASAEAESLANTSKADSLDPIGKPGYGG